MGFHWRLSTSKSDQVVLYHQVQFSLTKPPNGLQENKGQKLGMKGNMKRGKTCPLDLSPILSPSQLEKTRLLDRVHKFPWKRMGWRQAAGGDIRNSLQQRAGPFVVAQVCFRSYVPLRNNTRYLMRASSLSSKVHTLCVTLSPPKQQQCGQDPSNHHLYCNLFRAKANLELCPKRFMLWPFYRPLDLSRECVLHASVHVFKHDMLFMIVLAQTIVRGTCFHTNMIKHTIAYSFKMYQATHSIPLLSTNLSMFNCTLCFTIILLQIKHKKNEIRQSDSKLVED